MTPSSGVKTPGVVLFTAICLFAALCPSGEALPGYRQQPGVGGAFRLRRSVCWPAGQGRVEAIAASGRDRGFVALDAAGGLRWLHSTTGKELLTIPAATPAAILLALNARSDTMLTFHGDGSLLFQRMDASHPEAGWAGFFPRLLYEGYERAAFVWQSTGSDTRYTLVLRNGAVSADSDEDAGRMENHLNRPEIAAALAGGKGIDTRASPTLGTEWLYVAVPLPDGNVVRAAASLEGLKQRLAQ